MRFKLTCGSSAKLSHRHTAFYYELFYSTGRMLRVPVISDPELWKKWCTLKIHIRRALFVAASNMSHYM